MCPIGGEARELDVAELGVDRGGRQRVGRPARGRRMKEEQLAPSGERLQRPIATAASRGATRIDDGQTTP